MMSDMAYNNNAVHLTMDAYISRNIENENKNENENEKTEDSLSDESSERGSENEVNDNNIIPFSELRKTSYRNWLSTPHTPYKNVSSSFHFIYLPVNYSLIDFII